MKALLTNFHQSPQKVRLVADMIRGKSVAQARTALTFMPKKASPAILTLLNSAIANARTQNASVDELIVKTITVNKGAVLKRFAPRARGRASRFSRTMSIVAIELGTQSQKVKKGKSKMKNDNAKTENPTVKKAAKKVAKKVVKAA
jgi:large subunit ribosomal protein L22